MKQQKEKRLYGMLVVSNDKDGYSKGKVMFDGFEGIIIYSSWDEGNWYVIEGYYSKDSYKTKSLGGFPEEELDKAKNAKEMAEIIKEECLRLFYKKEEESMHYGHEKDEEIFMERFPDIAMDKTTALIIQSRADYEATP